jgi:Ca2+-transporting ATPase
MSDTFSELLLVGAAVLFGFPTPLSATQIFWINVISDGLPSMALTMDESDGELLYKNGIVEKESIMNVEMKTIIFVIGIVTDIFLLSAYLLLLKSNFDLAHVRTIIFTALSIDSLFYVFSTRTLERSIFSVNPFSNLWLVAAVLISFAVQLLVVYEPHLQKVFGTVSLHQLAWLIIFVLSSIKLFFIELTKDLFNKYKWKTN